MQVDVENQGCIQLIGSDAEVRAQDPKGKHRAYYANLAMAAGLLNDQMEAAKEHHPDAGKAETSNGGCQPLEH